MKIHLFTLYLFLAPIFYSYAAISILEEGTLTLSGDKVIFKVADKPKEYVFNNMPGLKAIKFEKRSKMEGTKEIDISELTLFCPQNNKKIILVTNQPVAVSHHVVHPGSPDAWAKLK